MKKLLTILTIIFVLISPKSALADNREYFIDNLNINAQILPNGDVVVNEILQYRFDGEFNGIYRNLNLNGTGQYLINSVSIIDSSGNIIEATEGYNEENNTYEIKESSDSIQIKLFCKSINEIKNINLNYTIKGAAKKYTDYSQLYWNFYNVKNIDSVKEGTLKITLKDTSFSTEVLSYDIYGDGDITASNTENSIDINFKNLTTLIGIDLKFQKEYLSIVEEISPENYEDNYIMEDFNYYGKEENNKDVAFAITVFVIIGVVIAAFAMDRRGFNKEVSEYRAKGKFTEEEFIMEPPSDLPPALVNLLMNEKVVSKEMLNITLFYLVNKGYYRIEEKTTKDINDLVFIRTNYNKESEYSHLNFLLDWFKDYEVAGRFSIGEIKSSLSSSMRAKRFIDNLNYWLIKVRSDGENIGFYIKIRNKNIIGNNWYSEKCKWNAYKKYLKNIYKFNGESNDSLSDLTIIYASALEVKESQLKEIIDSVTSKTNDNINSFSNSDYMYMNNYLLYMSMFDNMANDALHIANPPSSSNNFTNGGDDSGGGNFFGGGDFTGGGGGDSGAF
ncbi:DUF2207 domain-containing protein [uncultured Clostridium sp.]|uniref:DUF2207 domain-containing protein n=1 Tax=uncultured Clostridium sp. TaxID=59620 RepID=UPI0025DAABCD|nr:DUF2207 domain-containing protein [uncultured Clostridium sp.]MDU4884672.1 DUF2207 domain-containing protein [Clostridium celatum]MDU7077867.1 DUF2207 domain-containing protein [Clostridium celatum]